MCSEEIRQGEIAQVESFFLVSGLALSVVFHGGLTSSLLVLPLNDFLLYALGEPRMWETSRA